MNFYLLIHDIGYILDFILLLSLIVIIYIKAPKGVAKSSLIIAFIGALIFTTSHILGVSVSDPELSQKILMFNLAGIFMPIFTARGVFALIGKKDEQTWFINTSLVIGVSIVIFFILNPKLLLLTSVPKMYFPNYYVAGPYYWVLLLFFFLFILYFMFWMFRKYLSAKDIQKNRILYFMIALGAGYTIGSLDILLAYNIQFDPIWGFLFVPLFSIPFTYAVLQYNLLNITFVAQKAFVYASVTAVTGLILIALNYINTVIIQSYPGFPDWSSSIVLAFFVALAVLFIWRRIREADILKYEFINVVTHKFRTPLTSIKWTNENLREIAPENMLEGLRHIEVANEKLVDLTNLLVNLSGMDDKSYEYIFSKIDIASVVNRLMTETVAKAKDKNIKLVYVPKDPIFINADEQKIKFVLQTLVDNAISYTPMNGTVRINISDPNLQLSSGKLIIQISDSGIGIPKEEIKYIFTKFYRATNGRKADTEGMGIGLYLSKHIIERHKGTLEVSSVGENSGTTFTITLPLIK